MSKKEVAIGELNKRFKERDNQLEEIYNMMGTAKTKAVEKKPKKKSIFNPLGK
jgi:hypothetical protein